MRYISTRGLAPPVSFLDAVLAGMAPDGGLYVPESWPGLPLKPRRIVTSHYANVASRVLEAFAGDDLGAEAGDIATSAYIDVPANPHDRSWRGKWPEAVTPLRQIRVADWLLELFHGPSLSFKDVAMQLIGPLYDLALSNRDARLSVVCATSGDTGGAAVEALKRSGRVDLFVLTPKGRVSDVQRRFMTTSGAANIYAIEIDGDFDACQAIVKSLFGDRDFAARAHLSGVNSINWARIVAQSVYYQIAAHTLSAHGPVDFVVPTGNFGDAFSGWVAKQMGAPVGRIVLATNANDILVRALNTGRYERGVSQETLSPAMDIQVASNFERILFEALDRDGEAVTRLYTQMAQSGGFDIPQYALERLRADFSAAEVDDAQTLQSMAWAAQDDAPVCPHTAVGLVARSKVTHGLSGGPVVFLATAHPAKFPGTVERATGARPPLPAKCADLFQRDERFDSLPADVEVVKQYIRERSRAWS
ncbi:MAG TPA: threonine synthase [Vitreimonas sp.]|uniref:threonine synthase n=1 Tax=Vitreimonas sp. TaxID=3069702 RepID=UPI002D6C3FB2|nr:threonine synthase [Vitreimonas sp.]HYD87285.1 threonine synthase [Vitreimonas sp.]